MTTLGCSLFNQDHYCSIMQCPAKQCKEHPRSPRIITVVSCSTLQNHTKSTLIRRTVKQTWPWCNPEAGGKDFLICFNNSWMNSVTKCLQMEIFFDLFVTVLRVELSSTSTKKCFPVQAWVTRRRKREKGEIIFGFFVCNDRCRVNNGTTKADSNLAL